jgi:hypothetical protein
MEIEIEDKTKEFRNIGVGEFFKSSDTKDIYMKLHYTTQSNAVNLSTYQPSYLGLSDEVIPLKQQNKLVLSEVRD